MYLLIQNQQNQPRMQNQQNQPRMQNQPKQRIQILPIYTRRVPDYKQIGILYDNRDIYRLFGRTTHVRSSRWNYYIMNDDDIMIPVFIKRNCTKTIGCKELYTGDTVKVAELANRIFTVRIY